MIFHFGSVKHLKIPVKTDKGCGLTTLETAWVSKVSFSIKEDGVLRLKSLEIGQL